MNKLFFSLCVGMVMTVLIAGCGGSTYLKGDRGLKETVEGQEAATDRYIMSSGIGVAAKDAETATQKYATARNAAIVDAQYRLASIINGVKITGGITVEKAMQTDAKIRTEVDSVIRGAEVIKEEHTSDDGCVITMRIDKKDLEKRLNVQFEK